MRLDGAIKTWMAGPAQVCTRAGEAGPRAWPKCQHDQCYSGAPELPVWTRTCMTKTTPGNFFEDFRLGQTIRARDAAHGHARRCRALQRAVRRALRAAVLRPVRLRDRLSGVAARRPAGVPHRVRQDRAGHFAQCGRQSRLRGLPLPARGLSGRHADRDLGSDRAEGEFEPQDRRRLRALDRLQAGRRARCSNTCAG